MATYKKGMPIPFSFEKRHVIICDGDNYYLPWFEDTRFRLNFGRDRSNNRAIIDNCIKTKKYKLCAAAKIQLKERKLFLLITVDIPKAESVPVKGKVMGVDLGVINPAYVAVNVF